MSAKLLGSDDFQLGVCYYPEHWDESLWEDDFRRMKELGLSVVRVGEFAWTIFEPEDGTFSFDLFDRALDAAHRYGLKVIMGTPTATPPAWLTYRYPEVLNARQDGVVYQHGQRRHYNYSSPVYRFYCERIVKKMAEHYSAHPAIIGWQIDNELNCETSEYHSEADHIAFRKWARNKYGSLDKLNKAWGTVFWSQSYTDWEQVFLTRPTPSNSPNPHQLLDEKRFISDNTIAFARLQANILREYAPNQWVTTNGLFGHLDNHAMTDELLDFYSYDSYPQFSSLEDLDNKGSLRDRRWSLALSESRSISPQFCVMEQQSGPGGWVNRMEMPAPRPGQVRLWTYQSIAHGADMLLYFRWRTATMGTEIYWHGINDYHNRPNRRVREIAQIGEELNRVGSWITGQKFNASVALLEDYDNSWDAEFDVWVKPLRWQSREAWHKALQERHLPVDVVYMRDNTTLEQLRLYPVLVYAHATILTEQRAAMLDAYVKGGGTLIMGARTGYKDERGQCRMIPFPGFAADWCGITVEDFTLCNPNYPAAAVHWKDAEAADSPTALFNEVLNVESTSTEIMATYTSAYYSGGIALTRNRHGEGFAWYLGSAFTEQIVHGILDRIGVTSPAAGWLELPKQVEIAIRGHLTFLLNYSHKPVWLNFLRPVSELLTSHELNGRVELAPYGVFLIKS
ncbi:beta-galactosidase [Cohnella mopanensis]|uniref:beta-galactosidase n=1 Tax=Cohnella mopanensis TaxID=2911966 RepID=UPI001EF8DB3F|nr:beta-galactosidase [Cohnella mopanensis]